jgi:hypothetical protein
MNDSKNPKSLSRLIERVDSIAADVANLKESVMKQALINGELKESAIQLREEVNRLTSGRDRIQQAAHLSGAYVARTGYEGLLKSSTWEDVKHVLDGRYGKHTGIAVYADGAMRWLDEPSPAQLAGRTDVAQTRQ